MDPGARATMVTQMGLLVTVCCAYQTMLINILTAYRQRRMHRLRMIMAYRRRMLRNRVLMIMSLSTPKPRRMWKRARSEDWWTHTVPNFDDEQWIENFRVRKSTFEYICNCVRETLAPNPNQVVENHSLSVEKIVAIALYKLAHVVGYQAVGHHFGVHKSSVHNCLYAFCLALTTSLDDQLIRMPNDEEARVIADRFEEKTLVPQMVGAIGACHIPITAPKEKRADFVNRKGGCSLVLQAVVDDQCIFRDISCRSAGALQEADVLRESALCLNMETLTMIPKGVKNVDGKDIPFFLAGNPAYPLLPWLIKGYNYDLNISPEMECFNLCLNSGQVVVQNAFARLKGRWRILLKRTKMCHVFFHSVIAACCILHNICEVGRETFNNNWLDFDDEAEPDCVVTEQAPFDADNQPEAALVRDHIAVYLARNFEIRQNAAN